MMENLWKSRDNIYYENYYLSDYNKKSSYYFYFTIGTVFPLNLHFWVFDNNYVPMMNSLQY